MRNCLFVLVLLLVLAFPVLAQDDGEDMMADPVSLEVIGRYETGVVFEGAAEIGAYDAGSQRLFVTNADADTIDILDISDPTNPTLVSTISFDDFGSSINSVAVFDGLVAAAIEAEEIDAAGRVVFTDIDGNVLNDVEAGVLPDMLAFSPDGTRVLVANEGEPNDSYEIDPEGSVTIVDLSEGVENATVTQVSFAGFNDNAPEGLRVFGPGATVAQDLEPEYVAITPDGSTAFIALQENNGLAVIDIENAEATALIPLGFKDHSVEGAGFDASNEDGVINIEPRPTFGMYQPDAIAVYEANGEVFIVTANEGDAREYEDDEGNGFVEEARIAEVTLDAEAFPNAEELQAEENLGRLLMTTTLGDTDGDGEFEELYTFGARSFTIWNTSGEIVFDSGDQFEQITSERLPEIFNSNGTIDSFDQRSDDKGPEPEGVVVGTVDDVTLAFIGLERIGGVMVYDVTDPTASAFVGYTNTSIIDGNVEEGTAGDQGPEGLIFISAEDSPNGMPLLVVTNEVSGTTTIFEIVLNVMG